MLIRKTVWHKYKLQISFTYLLEGDKVLLSPYWAQNWPYYSASILLLWFIMTEINPPLTRDEQLSHGSVSLETRPFVNRPGISGTDKLTTPDVHAHTLSWILESCAVLDLYTSYTLYSYTPYRHLLAIIPAILYNILYNLSIFVK